MEILPPQAGWPEHFHLLPRIRKLGHFLARTLEFLPEKPLSTHTTHFQHTEPVRGAEHMLSRELRLDGEALESIWDE